MEKRYKHGAISNGIETMIIGGISKKIEVWYISEEPQMHEYKAMNVTISDNSNYIYPALFIVPAEYCQRNPNFLAVTLSWSLGLFLGLYYILFSIKCYIGFWPRNGRVEPL